MDRLKYRSLHLLALALRNRVNKPTPLVVALLSRVNIQFMHSITLRIILVVALLSRVTQQILLVVALLRVNSPVHLALRMHSITVIKANSEVALLLRHHKGKEMDNKCRLIKGIPSEATRVNNMVTTMVDMALAMVVIKPLHLPAHSALHRLCIIVTKFILEMVINISVLIKPMVLDNILFLIKLPLACLREEGNRPLPLNRDIILGLQARIFRLTSNQAMSILLIQVNMDMFLVVAYILNSLVIINNSVNNKHMVVVVNLRLARRHHSSNRVLLPWVGHRPSLGSRLEALLRLISPSLAILAP